MSSEQEPGLTLECPDCYAQTFGLFWEGELLMARCRNCGGVEQATVLDEPAEERSDA